MSIIKALIKSYKSECEASASALGWGTEDQAREHELRAEGIWHQIVEEIGEDEARLEVFE